MWDHLSRTSLVREVHRQAVTKYERHTTNANWIVIETIIPSSVGGFTIREMGIIANGKLISHGSHAPFEKVADPSGVSEYRLRFTQNVTDGSVVELTLDESLIYATQAWIDENYIKRSEIVDNLTTNDATKPVSAAQAKLLQDNKLDKFDLNDATVTQKGVVQLNNTLTSTAITQALTAAQGKILNDQAFGVGVDYYDVTSLRVKGTIYTATGSKPRQLCIDVESSGSSNGDILFVRKNDLSPWMPIAQRGSGSRTIFPIILPGYQYKYESPTNFSKWIEVY